MNTNQKSVVVDVNKRYSFPHNIKEVRYNGKILIISIDTARWIVLENDRQLAFFHMLMGSTIQEAIEKFGCDQDCKDVLIQIEAKQFESDEVKKTINGQKTMHFYLTNGCNMHCPHCYMFAGKKFDDELSTKEVLSVIREFSQSGGVKVTFSGGEVATRIDLEEIIVATNSLGIEIELLTNGTLWDENRISRIASMIKSVQVSIDGYDETSNSKVRGSGNFEKALNSVGLFYDFGVKTEVSVVPYYDEQLENNIIKYADFAKKLVNKYKGLSVRFATDMLDGREIRLTRGEKERYSSIVTGIYSAYYGEDMVDYPFVQQRKQGHLLNNCMFGELSVSANGDVFPCSRVLSAKPLGNVRHTDFKTILMLANKAEQLSEVTNLRPCKDCELMYICGGGCRIDYFPDLLSCDIDTSLSVNIRSRQCSDSYKAHFYDLMIKTNTKIFQ